MGEPGSEPGAEPGLEPGAAPPLRLTFAFERAAGPGGAEKVLRDVAAEMAARGHAVEVLSADRPGERPFHAYPDAVRLTPLGGPRGALERAGAKVSNGLHRLGLTGGALASRLAWAAARAPVERRAAQTLAARRPDVAIGFTPNGVGLLAPGARALGVPLIASLHNAPAIETAVQPHEGFLHQKRRGIAAVARADLILALLEDYLLALAGQFPGVPSEVMPNAIEGPAAPPPPVSDRPLKIVCVGRLAPEKRQILALEAWARLAPRFSDWRLEIWGAGAERAALEAAIGRLGLAGSAALKGTTRDIDAMFAGARLMAHPSAHEGFPLAVGEALARGVPVVGFADCSGLAPMIGDGAAGALIAPGEDGVEDRAEDRAEALAECLGRLMGDEGALERLSAAGPGAMAPYAMGPTGDRWEAALRRLAARPRLQSPRL